MCTGDLIAQTIIEEKKFKDVDKVRSAQFFTIGAGIVVRVTRGLVCKSLYPFFFHKFYFLSFIEFDHLTKISNSLLLF